MCTVGADGTGESGACSWWRLAMGGTMTHESCAAASRLRRSSTGTLDAGRHRGLDGIARMGRAGGRVSGCRIGGSVAPVLAEPGCAGAGEVRERRAVADRIVA